MVDNYFTKERQLYAAYQKARSKRRKVHCALEEQGYSIGEIGANSNYIKACDRAEEAFCVWDTYRQTRKEQ